MANYYGSKTDIINEVRSEIESSLQEIGNNLEILENLDWDEILEHVPNGEDVLRDITQAIDEIRYAYDDLK